MSRDLADLTPEFQAKIAELLRNLQTRGVIMVPYFTLRTPQDQAELYRQSRGAAEIATAIAGLRGSDAWWLASVLEDAPPKTGPWATNACPGNSFHQFGLACDFYWQTPTGIQWGDGDGYIALAREASSLGLTPGRGFHHPDIDHVQMPSEGAPRDIYAWEQIDAAMKAKFGAAGA